MGKLFSTKSEREKKAKKFFSCFFFLSQKMPLLDYYGSALGDKGCSRSVWSKYYTRHKKRGAPKRKPLTSRRRKPSGTSARTTPYVPRKRKSTMTASDRAGPAPSASNENNSSLLSTGRESTRLEPGQANSVAEIVRAIAESYPQDKSYENKIKTLEKDLKECNEEKITLKRKVDEQHAIIEALEKKCEEGSNKCPQLEKIVEDLRQQIVDLQADKANLTQRVRELEAREEQLLEQIKNQAKENFDLQAKFDDLENTANQLAVSQANTTMDNQELLSAKQKEIDMRNQLLQERQQALEELKAQHQLDVQSLIEAQSQALEQQKQLLEDKCKAATLEVEERFRGAINKTLTEAMLGMEDLQDQNKLFQEQGLALRQRIAELEGEVEALKQQNNEFAVDYYNTQQVIEASNKFLGYDSSMQGIKRPLWIQRVVEELQAQRVNSRELLNQRDRLTEELQRCREELSALKDAIKLQAGVPIVNVQEYNQLKQAYDETYELYQRLLFTTKQVDEAFKQSQDYIKTLEAKYQEMAAQNVNYRSQLETMDAKAKDYDRLKKEYDYLDKAYENRGKYVAEVQRDRKGYVEKSENLEKLLKTRTDELNHWKFQYGELQKKFEDQQAELERKIQELDLKTAQMIAMSDNSLPDLPGVPTGVTPPETYGEGLEYDDESNFFIFHFTNLIFFFLSKVNLMNMDLD